mmetsp:Transcript_6010/g.15482  ORF Transcript_6010/g.15482 Transcript_6010/m.15482 type:complete len:214 (+) Transcript_6010:101-742(+)
MPVGSGTPKTQPFPPNAQSSKVLRFTATGLMLLSEVWHGVVSDCWIWALTGASTGPRPRLLCTIAVMPNMPAARIETGTRLFRSRSPHRTWPALCDESHKITCGRSVLPPFCISWSEPAPAATLTLDACSSDAESCNEPSTSASPSASCCCSRSRSRSTSSLDEVSGSVARRGRRSTLVRVGVPGDVATSRPASTSVFSVRVNAVLSVLPYST